MVELPDENIPFALLLKRIEDLVKKLESGELPLEDSLRIYEEGVSLVRLAQGKLEVMEGKIEILLADGQKKPFEDASALAG